MSLKKTWKFIKRCCLAVIVLPLLYFVFVMVYANFFFKDAVYSRLNLEDHYPKIITPKSSKAVIKGEYLVKAGNCITCHTSKVKEPFAGGLPIQTPFGQIPSTNITPDKNTGIGSWSKEEFIEAMRKGESPQGQYYYPAFPFPYFKNITDQDLSDMFVYLKQLPSIEKVNSSPTFPLNLTITRKLMPIWQYFARGSIPYVPSAKKRKSKMHRGAYLVNGLGHCGMCHTPYNSIGIPKMKNYLAGNFVGGYWAPDITMKGLSHSSDSELVQVLKNSSLLNSADPLAGPMADVTHNSTHWLNTDDVNAIITYLKSVNSEPVLSVKPESTSLQHVSLQRGKLVYVQVCLVCHQDGITGAPKIGNQGSWFNRIQQSGLNELYQRTFNGFNNMPVMGGCVNCTNNDIISAVNYILFQSLTQSQKQVLFSDYKKRMN